MLFLFNPYVYSVEPYPYRFEEFVVTSHNKITNEHTYIGIYGAVTFSHDAIRYTRSEARIVAKVMQAGKFLEC